MTWCVAATAMLAAGAFPLWPLLSHHSPSNAEAGQMGSGANRSLALEELELDVAAGRVGEQSAADLRASWDR